MRTFLLIVLCISLNACEAQHFRSIRIHGLGHPIKLQRAGRIDLAKEQITIRYTAGGVFQYRVIGKTPPYVLSFDQLFSEREIWIFMHTHVVARRIYVKGGRLCYIDYLR